MPCRALEAFGGRIRESENRRIGESAGDGRLGSRQDTRCPADKPLVIGHSVIRSFRLPCRALEAFRPRERGATWYGVQNAS